MKIVLKCLLPLLLLLSACKKDKIASGETGEASIVFENYVGQNELLLNQQLYSNANGDSFLVTKYMYYVTDVNFIKADGTSVSHDDYKFLINAEDPTTLNNLLKGIPAGTYTSIGLTLGVDSVHNVSGAQTGVLDPIHGMFWDWNTGYIMAKLEGNSPQSTAPMNKLSFHLGGFSGSLSVVKKVSFPLATPLVITKDKKPIIKFRSDLNKWFEGDFVVDFAIDNSVMSIDRLAHRISENYKYHLSLISIEN